MTSHSLRGETLRLVEPTDTDQRKAGRALVSMALTAFRCSGFAASTDLDEDSRAALVDVLQMMGLMPCPEVERRGTHGTLLRYDNGCPCARCAEADAGRTARRDTHKEACS
ncbi:hypothetical protein [Embleya sp. NPDC005971]|uniref:hypothetical protein n=1 Tax=Embleya sp. NPDC005971 TaxID=3156724 RepID=UPI0033E1CEB1